MEQLKNLYLKQSLIPKRYLSDISLVPSKKDENAFIELNDIRINAKDFVRKGENLFIYSSHSGNGKTTWATKIMKEYVDQISDVYYNHPAIYINVNSFLNQKKIAISNKDLRDTIEEIEDNILGAKLVIFDDIGVTNISDYDSNLLYYWINHRTDYSLSCIYTSNLTPNKLKQVIDERIYSRIINYSKLIEITDGDNRKNDNTVTGA